MRRLTLLRHMVTLTGCRCIVLFFVGHRQKKKSRRNAAENNMILSFDSKEIFMNDFWATGFAMLMVITVLITAMSIASLPALMVIALFKYCFGG